MNNLKALERQASIELADSLARNPQDWSWRNGDFDVVLGPGGIRMSANYFTIYHPETVRFGFWNKHRIRRAFRRWKSTAGNKLADTERYRSLVRLRQCLATRLRAVA